MSNSCFIKTEFEKLNNIYIGPGFRLKNENAGSLEGLLAYKLKENKDECFAEVKYTSPSVMGVSLESRNRVITELNDENPKQSFDSRLAFKKNVKINDKFEAYQIMGVSCRFEDKKPSYVRPMSLTGVTYNIGDKISLYSELEFSDKIELNNHNNNDNNKPCNTSFYFGARVWLF